MRTRFLLTTIFCLLISAAEGQTPPSYLGDPAQLGRGIQRTMTLLATSTPEHRNTVRILFYGQSITVQDWWKQVAADLKARFPHANLIIENRALGGFASQRLVKTAETDLYPFQPDLLIFHVFGAHDCYEDIIRRTRERTTAEILIQTDHVNANADWRHEETDPAKVTTKDWNSFMNYKHLPAVIRRYGCGYVDQRNLWKRYLTERGLEAPALLRDGVHLNEEGCRVMAAFVKAALVKRDEPAIDPMNCDYVRTLEVGKDLDITSGTLKLQFDGSRVDLIAGRASARPIVASIDGKTPSEHPELHCFTRALPKPGGSWPVVADLSSEKPLLVEDWTMIVDRDPVKEDLFTFTLSGSKTGLDGSGRSDARFVSQSGRVVIDPEDWDVSYALGLAKVKPVPPKFTVRWSVLPRYLDQWQPAVPKPGFENAVTLAHGLADGPHTLELTGDLSALAAVRVYSPRKFLPSGPTAHRKGGSSPNVLVFLMDDLGWRDAGCYGGRFIDMPAADRLAREGMRFTDAYAAAPVCSPTRASLLTGQYPGRIGMYEVIQLRDRPYARLTSPPLKRELPESLQTIGEILSRRGYACGSIGKWHVGRTPVEEGLLPVAEKLDDPDLAALAARSSQKQVGKFTAQTLRFLREHRDQPFLLFLNHHAVHAPLAARPELIAKYQAKAARTGVSDIHPTYAAMTEMGDESLAQVLLEVERLGLAEKTMVIFTSDNGGLISDLHLTPPTPLATSNLPLRSQKGDLYEGGIRIPLIVRWPGKIAPASACRVPVTSPDLFATILEITGAAPPAGQSIDGVSLVQLLCQTGGIQRDSLFWHFPTSMWSRWPGGAIRKDNLKLIEFFEDDRVELYDLACDLGETQNLAAERPGLVKDLRGRLQRWRQSIGAQMPVPNPHFDPDRADLLPDPPMIPITPIRRNAR